MRTGILGVIILLVVMAYFFWPSAGEEVFEPQADPAALRKTASGIVQGYIGQKGAHIWQGIPYAQPPIGPLRWRAPLPLLAPSSQQEEVLQALAPGNVCPQLPSLLTPEADPTSVVTGSEDCLYLNIFAPPDADNLPVMYWLHGGGNSVGEGGSYSGANLALVQDVVVVTINYRLGVFGWFSHPALTTGDPRDDSGNYGTLDAIQGLAWVRDNIAAFGGNPDSVTVFGESAGAYDTLAMMASPLAEGLFHRAIVQSGGFETTPLPIARSSVADGGHPLSSAEIVKKLLVRDGRAGSVEDAGRYADDMSTTAMRDYLYSKAPEELFALFDGGGFGMVDLPMVLGDGFVLPDLSTEAIFSDPERHNMVPVILGTNRDEPSLFMTRDPRYVKTFLGFFPRLKDEAAYLRTVRYGALAWKYRGVDSLANAMRAAGNSNVYAYRFDWDEEPSQLGFDLSVALGAAHALEIPFVFNDFAGGLGLGYLYPFDDAQQALADSMSSYWTAFAYHGRPGRGRDGKEVAWLGWKDRGKTSLILDSLNDQGIFMDDQEVTLASMKAELAADDQIQDEMERCTHYARMFRGKHFIDAEYQALGGGFCGQIDPKSISMF
ncbi:MAG: carboxylesterase/lipase family protein [OM182 bacterium]|nr:MAG: carboxylesterase/lipase family protein [OM182 bacterium]